MAGIIYSYPIANAASSSTAHLCIDGGGGRYRIDSGMYDSRTVTVLEKFLGNEIDQRVAADQFASEVARSASEDDEGLEEAMMGLWNLFLAYAIEQPSSHSQLAELIKYLVTMPDVEQLEATDHYMFRYYLHQLEAELYDEWRYIDIPKKGGHERESCIARWQAVNRFTAHFIKLHVEQLDVDLYVLWTFREALEDIKFSKPDIRKFDEDIPAAAALIDVAGDGIFKLESHFPPSTSGGRPGSGGALWDGKHGFCRGRWDLWKRNFNAIANIHYVSESTRELARTAAENMAKVEEMNPRGRAQAF